MVIELPDGTAGCGETFKAGIALEAMKNSSIETIIAEAIHVNYGLLVTPRT